MLAGDCAELTGQLEDALLELRDLFGGRSLLGGNGGVAHFVLDSDFEIDELVGKGADGVVEAEAVFAYLLCGEYVVALALLCAIEDGLLFARLGAGTVDCVVDCGMLV